MSEDRPLWIARPAYFRFGSPRLYFFVLAGVLPPGIASPGGAPFGDAGGALAHDVCQRPVAGTVAVCTKNSARTQPDLVRGPYGSGKHYEKIRSH